MIPTFCHFVTAVCLSSAKPPLCSAKLATAGELQQSRNRLLSSAWPRKAKPPGTSLGNMHPHLCRCTYIALLKNTRATGPGITSYPCGLLTTVAVQ